MVIWTIDASVKKQVEKNIKQHKNLYIFNGIVFIILGLVALMTPLIAAEFLDLLIGSLLLLTGLFQATVSFATKRHWAFYLSAFISVGAGSLMIARPLSGALALAAVIATFLLLQGLVQIFTAGMYAPFKGWGWILTTGLISISLAALVYAGWPISAIWFLGVLVGINLVSFGISMITLTTFIARS